MDEKTDFILEVFDLLRNKFKRGDCTKEQTDAMYRVLSENLPIWATSDELAEHYGKSKAAVNGIIKRKMIPKPRRNVSMYSFNVFHKLVPKSWTKHH